MTTITERARLEELLAQYWEIAFEESSGVTPTGNKANGVLHEIRAIFDVKQAEIARLKAESEERLQNCAALVAENERLRAAPATTPEKTVKEIMEFVRHYAANTFSSATLEDKIRRSLAAPATAPERKPMPILEVNARWEQSVLGITRLQYYQVIREVEAFHGIKDDKP